MTDQTLNSWRQTIRGRVLFAAAVFALWGAGIEARLVHLQIFKHDRLQAYADSQANRKVEIPATRGEILDRYGRVLARSIDGSAVIAVPAEVQDPEATAAALCDAFGDCTAQERAQILQKLRKRNQFAYIRRSNRVTLDAADRVAALGLPGIGLKKEPKRFYPNGELAAHVLGFVGLEDKGAAGVEEAWNAKIKGTDGSELIQVDAHQHPFSSVERPPIPGTSLQLTIDWYLQHAAETELKAGVEEFGAQGGTAVVMDPNSGDILALANYPSFDPNTYSQFAADAKVNRGIQNTYEPGSTFKIVTASAALQEGVMKPDDRIDTGDGSIRIGSRKPIHDTHRYGVLTFTDVLVKSSNVGAIKIGLRVGAERLGRYVQGFGFGSRLDPGLNGESRGLLWNPANWNESTLASVSMGYQIGVTPLQMATAASVVANGGRLFQPRIVKAMIRPDGRSIEVQPKVLRRVIEPATADQMTTIMENVVERGTATAAKIPGYSIAGKTGTAAKLEDAPNGKKYYSKSDYNGSFVGFIPSRKPVLTILVVLDSPHGKGYYGGTVSAPIFKRIAQKAMQHLGIPPNVTPEAPLLASRHDGKTPVRTAAPFKMPPAIVPAVSGQPGGVPDLIGLSAREAIRVLARAGVSARVSGDGVVVQQEPRAGTPLEPGMTCILGLGRLAAPVPAVSAEQRQ